MWRKPMSKQHKPPQAVACTSRLFGIGLGPEFVLIVMIATKKKQQQQMIAMKQKLIRIEFKMVKYYVDFGTSINRTTNYARLNCKLSQKNQRVGPDPSHLILNSTKSLLRMTQLKRKDQTAVPSSNYVIYCTQPGRDYVTETNVQTAFTSPNSCTHIKTCSHYQIIMLPNILYLI